MKKIYACLIPCIFTAANLFCGFVAVQFVISKDFIWAAWYILFAMIFDIMDGRIARITSGTSLFGAEFDSLADLISFGIAPALLIYYRYIEAHGILGIIVSFLFLLCGAIRLARFNVMPPTPYFLGLPIPAGAAFVASIVLAGTTYNFDAHIKTITLLTFLVSILMISKIPYPALKKINKNKPTLFKRVLTQIGFWLIIIFAYIISIERAIFLAVISYLFSGMFYYIFKILDDKGYIELLINKIYKKNS